MSRKFTKGDRVLARATVRCGYQQEGYGRIIVEPPQKSAPDHKRTMVRIPFIEFCEAIVVGYSWRATGVRTWDECVETPRYLMFEKRHSVVMVQPTHTSRWLKTHVCLEEDLELCE